MYKIIKTVFLVLSFTIAIFYLHTYFFKKKLNCYSEHSNILAVIDGYNLTLGDYLQQQAKLAPFYGDKPIDKKYILNNMIDNIVLLKEAERMGLNKDVSFLKEIELFWRQSLIGTLLKKKNMEIKKNIVVTDEEIQNFYESLKTEYYLRYLVLSEDVIDLKISDDQIGDQFLSSHNNFVQYDSGLNWTDGRSIDPRLRKEMFSKSLKLNKWHVIRDLRNTFLIYIEQVRSQSVEDFDKLKSEIEMIIREDKEQQSLKDWTSHSRNKMKITINEDLISKI